VKSLLKTEKEAQQIVATARSYRASKLKAAKADAQAEIETYKAKKAAELKAFQDEFASSNVQLEENAAKEVQTELAKIKQTAQEKKAAVIKLLVDSVTSPKPELHANA
jgi:ATP synthase subunit G